MITVPSPLVGASRRLISPLVTVCSWPKIYTIPTVVLALVVLTAAAIFIPRPTIAFSYAQTAHCLDRLTFLPDLHQSSSQNNLSLTFSQHWSVANYNLVAQQVCLQPTDVPQPGSYQPSLALFGQSLLSMTYHTTIPDYPQVDTQALDQPIAVSRTLTLAMSQPDQLFDYQLVVETQSVDCHNQQSDLACPIDQLDLKQGQSYPLKIQQLFDQQLVQTVAEQQVETLSPTSVVSTSLTKDQVIYDKPQSMEITFDKPIVQVKATLATQADQPADVVIDQAIDEAKLTLTWAEPLPRRTSFKLVLDQLQAQDGSSLLEPYQLPFSTSGGPKVTSISIGRSGVALGATAVINFDQAIDPNQDFASHLSLSPGQAGIAVRSSSLLVKLNNLAACTDFSLSLDNAIASPHQIEGDSAWTFTSRTICYTVQTIGYSVRGRPINAFIFGSGGTTILYTGAIHGNEVGTKYLMDSWVRELDAKARQLPAGRKIVVVPLLNPDGFALGTRNNANNVDLNRNFAVSDWQKNITDTSGRPIPNGGGTQPMSEPETKAIANFTSKLRPRTTMSFHNVGGVVIANQAGHSTALASIYSTMSGYAHATGQTSQTFDYAITGTYDDWIAEKLGLSSVLVETSSRTASQFSRNVSGLWRVANY